MIRLALWNLRSVENVASILRTADGFGVATVYFIGTTPHPSLPDDRRLPHIRAKMDRIFAKTALGAEKSLQLAYYATLEALRATLSEGTELIALEQTPSSYKLPALPPLGRDILLLVGEERHGLPPEILAQCAAALEIPMRGQKESFNVAVATGIALYALTN